MWRTLTGGMVGVLLAGACAATPAPGRLGEVGTAALPRARATQSRPVRSTARDVTTPPASVARRAPGAASRAHTARVVTVAHSVAPAPAALRLAAALDAVAREPNDATLAARITIPGSPFALATRADVAALRRAHRRRVVAGVRRRVVKIVSIAGGSSYEVFVDVTAGEAREVDASGAVVSRHSLAPTHWTYFLAWWPPDRWVLANVAQLHPEWLE
jgi:hypothetical protein